MSWEVVVQADGIELRSTFRTRRFLWRDIAGFFLREGDFKAAEFGFIPFLKETDQVWVTVRGGDQYRLRGLHSDEAVLELNRLLEEGRRKLS
jgi:hypothetical protein